MNAGIIARLARVESNLRPAAATYDMSGLTDAELEMLSSLPRDEAALQALIETADFDWMPIARIIERLTTAG
jgi:hypothetical protein